MAEWRDSARVVASCLRDSGGHTLLPPTALLHFLHSYEKHTHPRLRRLDSCWNGDRRLREKYGDEVFEAFKEQTSVLPFQAILEVSGRIVCRIIVGEELDAVEPTPPLYEWMNHHHHHHRPCLSLPSSSQGRQELPGDYWKEFARLPYLVIGVGTLGAYLLHPFMQAGSWVVRG